MIHQTRTKVKDVLAENKEGQEILVWGWIRSSRFSKALGFIQINDGSSFESLQLVIDLNKMVVNKSELLTGSCIKVSGKVVESQGGNQDWELQTSRIEVVGVADNTYPLQKKRHRFEFLREIPHLRTKSNTFLAVFKVRNRLSKAIHDFFQEKGFLYVHAPILTVNDCEGGGEAFQATNLNLDEINGTVDYSNDFFKQKVFLTVSGQLEAEPFALSHGEVYTFGPTFRADPSDTPRHAAEFWMIEPEMAFYDFEDLRLLIQEFIKSITLTIKEECQAELAFLKKFVEPELDARFDAILDHDFTSITFEEAVDILNKSGKKFENKAVWGEDLGIEHERYLVDEHFGKPIFITDYPENFKSFYMRLNDDKKSVACLDLLVPGIGEIITGSQREERYDMLQSRLQSKGLEVELYQWYLETRRWGSAPHSGFGLGLERILMYLTGMKNIKDVIPFPRAGRKLY